MPADLFDQLAARAETRDLPGALELLVEHFRANRDHHNLFDALLMQVRHRMGLSLLNATGFDDVPQTQRDEFERAYVSAAREVGLGLLADGKLGPAWMYLRSIRETAPVRDYINGLAENSDEAIDIGLYQGVAPGRALQMLLASHGTCSSITALDQVFRSLSPADRSQCAGILVRRIYDDLRQTLERELARRQPLTAPGLPLVQLIAGREDLFANDNYHVDVSHLHAVVRFSRSFALDAPELPLAIELTAYGRMLAPQYQYAADPPFGDFYVASGHYLRALHGPGRDEALAYFRQQLSVQPGTPEGMLAALGFVELLTRLDLDDEAVRVAENYLTNVPEQYGFSFTDLCKEAGRLDVLQRVAKQQNDLVVFAAALLEPLRTPPPAA